MYKAQILDQSQHSQWLDFIAQHPLATIHQHPTWGQFQAKVPSRGQYWLIGLYRDQQLIGGTMLIRHGFHRNKSWLYSARGPLLDYTAPDLNAQMQALLEPIRQIARQQNSFLYRIDPQLPLQSPKPSLTGFHTSHLGFQPENTLILDLQPPEQQILDQMKPKGRYNIRLAERKNLRILKADPNSPDFDLHIDHFHALINETTTRDQFYGHKKQVYKAMIATLQPQNLAQLYLAYLDDQPLAGILVTFFQDTAIYYYGASSNQHRNLMAPYLLQWQAIRDAKACGCTRYDFLGIAPLNAKHHPWLGVTDFKLKFGGQRLDIQPPQEYALQPLYYWAFRLYKFLR